MADLGMQERVDAIAFVREARTARLDGVGREDLERHVRVLRCEVDALEALVRRMGYDPRPLAERQLDEYSHERALRRVLELERRHGAAVTALHGHAKEIGE